MADILGDPLAKQRAADEAARKAAAAKAAAEAKKKKKEEAAKKAAEEEAKKPRIYIASNNLDLSDEALIRIYGKGAPAQAAKQRAERDKYRAEHPSPGQQTGVPVTTVPPTSANTVGKPSWQQAVSVNIPANSFGSVVYLGTRSDGESHMGAAGVTPSRTESFDVADNVNNYYRSFDDADKQRMVAMMDKYYGKGKWDVTNMGPFWQMAVNRAATAYAQGMKVTPWDAMDAYVSASLKDGSAPAAASRPKTTAWTQKQVTLTDASSARALVNSALSQYLGRTATAQEQNAFLKALNAAESAAPKVTKGSTTTNAQGATTASSGKTTGGINQEEFAVEWARAQEGSAEHMAATTYMDAFMGALGVKVNPVGV